MPYFLKKLLLRAAIAVPTPRAVNGFFRMWAAIKAGENVGDMTLNGEVAFLERHAPSCHVVFDVGASDGAWTAHALRANPAATIHCFEPSRASFARLSTRDFPPAVTRVASGLSDREGSAQLFLVAGSLHGRRGPGFDSPAESESETVTVTTIDGYCAAAGIARIDLLKIDTDGHELAVLRGGEAMIRDGRIKRIQFEYGPRSVHARVFLRDFFSFFEGLPYQIHQVMPRRLSPVAYNHRLENFRYKNFVALHRSVAP